MCIRDSDGVTFDVLKFRTMGVDAEEQLAKLRAENESRGKDGSLENDEGRGKRECGRT